MSACHPAFFRRLAKHDTNAAVDRARAAEAFRLNVQMLMNHAVLECMLERRPVSPLDKPWSPPERTVAQKWRDEAAEHLAVRR